MSKHPRETDDEGLVPKKSRVDEDIVFQALSWSVDDGRHYGVHKSADPEDEDEEDEDEGEDGDEQFTVRIFGKTLEGQSVSASVVGHCPSFSVEFPCLERADKSVIDEAHEGIHQVLKKLLIAWKVTENDDGEKEFDSTEYGDHLLDASEGGLREGKTLWGFTTEKKAFFEFRFLSLKAYHMGLKVFRSCSQNHASDDQMQDLVDTYQQLRESKEFAAARIWKHEMALCLRGIAQRKPYRLKTMEHVIDMASSGFEVPPEPQDDLRFKPCVNLILRLTEDGMPLSYARCKLYQVVNPVLGFAQSRDLRMAGWMRLTSPQLTPEWDKETTCDIETLTHVDAISVVDDDRVCDFVEMTFDIETYCEAYRDNKFPCATNPNDFCYQIGVTVKRFSQQGFDRHLFHMRTPEHMRKATGKSGYCGPIAAEVICLRTMRPLLRCDGKTCAEAGSHQPYEVQTRVTNCETERELLIGFRDHVLQVDPDILIGYNSDKYDWIYTVERSKVIGCFDEFSQLSRVKNLRCKISEATFQSSAYGDNKYYRLDIPGRLNVDLLIFVQRNLPPNEYENYKLNTVAKKELKEVKRDVPAVEIFQAFESGDPTELARIGEYCCQDVNLTHLIFIKIFVLVQLLEMSNITFVPIMFLLQRGQEIKCFSQIVRKASELGFFVPIPDRREAGSFKGAVVLPPKSGRYEKPVAVLDFASLYPTVQMGYHVCYTTIVLDKKYANVPGVVYDSIEWDDDVVHLKAAKRTKVSDFSSIEEAAARFEVTTEEMEQWCLQERATKHGAWSLTRKHYKYTFAQNQRDVIPELQKELKKKRSAVKKMMAALENSKDPADQQKYRVLNARQLAIKVSMNSIYGFTSAFMLNLKPLSAAVTAMGRIMIGQTKNFMENLFNARCRKTLWTEDDFLTFYAPDGREVLARQVQRQESASWIFEWKGQIIETLAGETPPDWFKKFPSAIVGEPWAKHNLRVEVVGGDTDSVFCHFPESSLAETISLCHKAEVLLTQEVFNRPPIEMEYEKCYMGLVILKKKNYIGKKYGMNTVHWSVDYKGIAPKRRNYCVFTKRTMWAVICPSIWIEAVGDMENLKFKEASWHASEAPARALAALESNLQRLVDGQVPLEELVISAALKGSYRNEKECPSCFGERGRRNCDVCKGRGTILPNLPHVQLAKRMRERDEASAPTAGHRFGFIVVADPYRKDELSEKSEDMSFAREKNLKPDLIFYLVQQTSGPVLSFLEVIGLLPQGIEIFDRFEKLLRLKAVNDRSTLEMQSRKEFFEKKGRTDTVKSAPKRAKGLGNTDQKKVVQKAKQKTLESFFVKH